MPRAAALAGRGRGAPGPSMSTRFLLLFVAAIGAHGTVVGTNPPSAPLTATRIAKLPVEQQPAWRAYLARSDALRHIDQQTLANERSASSAKDQVLLSPAESRVAARRMLRHPLDWYATDEGRRAADNVVTFQTPAGGWGKNFDPTDHPRRPGEAYSHDNNSRYLVAEDNDRPANLDWSYIGTFDNDATTTELRFLGRVAARADAARGTEWRRAFRRGLEYIYAAQFPNGGWPQVFPLDGGYHDGVTFNDDAMTNVLVLLRDVAAGAPEFAWLGDADRQRAATAGERGRQCLLRCQVVVRGALTGWPQQADPLTLKPASARNYEMPALSSGETAGIVAYLMSLPHPSAEVIAAIEGAVHWLRATAMSDVAWRTAADGRGRTLVRAPGKGPLWPRYLEIGTNRALFGDRDKTIHDRLDEISAERRNGYAWYGDAPKRVLDEYPQWARAHHAR